MKNEVNTTLNQSLLRGEVVVSSGGEKKNLKAGAQMLNDIDWIHHDNITYLFPKPQTIFIKNEIAKGNVLSVLFPFKVIPTILRV